MEQALSGFRVIDFGQYIPGPYTAMLLAEQGAEVIKVERPEGDPARGDPGFMVWNRSKKSIKLDLKKNQAVRIALELIKKADVIIENFRPGVADRLGIGFDEVQKVNPKAIYCSISGFGQKGPYRDLPGWDPMVGTLSCRFCGTWGRKWNIRLFISSTPCQVTIPPLWPPSVSPRPYSLVNLPEKDNGSIFLCSPPCWALEAADWLTFAGRFRIPWSNPQGSLPLYKFYQGSDGKWFFLGLGNMTFFTKFAIVMEHEEWLADPRFEGAPFLIFPPVSDEIIAMFKEIFMHQNSGRMVGIPAIGGYPLRGRPPGRRISR